MADNRAVLAEVRELAEDVRSLDQQVRRLEQVLLPIAGRTDATGRALQVGQEICCEVDGQLRRGVVVPRGSRLVVALDPRLDTAADERRRVEAVRLGYDPE